MSIAIQNLSKSFGAKTIVSDFSLEIPDGTRLCVCGPNGTGKTTLLRLLDGEEQPDGGRVIYPAGARIGYVVQELGEDILQRNLLDWVMEVLPDWDAFWAEWEAAGARNDAAALAALAKKQADWEHRYGYNPEHRARAVLSGLGFQERKLSRSLGQLSGGWRERAKLARVLTAGADVLLLDEPTNHLDLDAVEWLENWLLNYEGVLVFVAHDRVFMDKVGTHVLFLGGAAPLFRRGSFSRFVELQEELEGQKEREAKLLAEDLERKMDFVRRFRAKPNKARQAASRQKMARRIEKELENFRPETKRRELAFRWPEPERSDRLVCSAENLGYSFPDGKVQFSGFNFHIYSGQNIALVGANGCGKTTLLRVMVGERQSTQGALHIGPMSKIGYFSQHQLEILHMDNSVLAEIRRLSDPRTTEEELMSVLGLFLLGQTFFERKVGTLSGGEKSRLVMAVLFLRRCNFLVLDEPTNHLDLESREALIEALESFPGTVLMVAHDRHLLSEVADEIWEFTPTGLKVYAGGYEEYLAARKAGNAEEMPAPERRPAPEKSPAAKAAAAQAQPAKNADSGLSREELRKLKRERAEQRNALYREFKPVQDAYARKEKDLEDAAAEHEAVQTQMTDPSVYEHAERVVELTKRFHALEELMNGLMTEMEGLEQELQIFEARKAALADPEDSA